MNLGQIASDQGQGREHGFQQTFDFPATAAREQGDDGALVVQSQRPGGLAAVGQAGQAIEERMPDVFGIDPGGGVKRHLERE